MWKAKVEFLWYNVGDEIKEQDIIHIDKYLKEGLVVEESVKKEEPKEELAKPEVKSRFAKKSVK